MDENENLLGLREIRERLINKEVIRFNKDLRYKGTVLPLTFDQMIFGAKTYKDYLTKNMFRFECKMTSKYNSETKWWETGYKKIVLIPTKYKNEIPPDALKDERNIFIDNADLFWQKPAIE